MCYFETLYEQYINEEIFHTDLSSYDELHYLLAFDAFLIEKMVTVSKHFSVTNCIMCEHSIARFQAISIPTNQTEPTTQPVITIRLSFFSYVYMNLNKTLSLTSSASGSNLKRNTMKTMHCNPFQLHTIKYKKNSLLNLPRESLFIVHICVVVVNHAPSLLCYVVRL